MGHPFVTLVDKCNDVIVRFWCSKVADSNFWVSQIAFEHVIELVFQEWISNKNEHFLVSTSEKIVPAA